ncbi:helitron_like_N domain-containing protein [Trichonephila clavipes]|nr:helitron_like_N domain-containing protein [Trichonephila clavipes]
MRAENYIHLQDAIRNDADLDPDNLGQMVILPSSFVNSARYLREYTQDAFTYVRNYGRPDLFITMTCNPAWPEITRELIPGQNSADRHDLTARVFKVKVQKLVALLTKGKIFGDMKCFMYSIEWQKRGLPYGYLLLWLMEKLCPNQIDEIIYILCIIYICIYTAGQLLRTDNTIIHSNHKMKGSKMWKIRISAGY